MRFFFTIFFNPVHAKYLFRWTANSYRSTYCVTDVERIDFGIINNKVIYEN